MRSVMMTDLIFLPCVKEGGEREARVSLLALHTGERESETIEEKEQ
jgi:hypothetical protein